MITRRNFIVSSSSGLVGCGLWGGASLVFASDSAPEGFVRELRRIEKASGGRLGVAMQDTGSGKTVGYSENNRFPMCSTFKVLAAAAVLAQVDAGKEQLSRRIKVAKADLLPYAPITEKHVGSDMTLAALCEAAVTLSDNTAANLILSCIGGPSGVTAYARTLGDQTTRLDRNEPALNHVLPGDTRDTTTPLAMMADLKALVLGDVLSPGSREQLIAWLKGCKTGGERLRAGLSKDWVVGDKTGTSDHTANDIAVIWPPNRMPIAVTAYLTDAKTSPEQCNKILAEVGRVVAAEVMRSK